MHDDDKHDDRDPLDGPRDGDDIDAAFAALVEGLDLSADEGVGPAEPDAGGSDAPRPEPADPGPSGAGGRNATGGVVHAPTSDEVPHNSYSAPEPAEAAPEAPKAIKIAVVLTPLASASALAALCAMSDLDCTIVPARSGAIAVKEFVSAHAEWDVAELLGGVETEPAEAAELAKSLSRLSRGGVVLMTADLATDVGIESGLSGTITARRYEDGSAGEEASSGLLLSAVDQVVEDILLGIVKADAVDGALRAGEVTPGRAMRWFGRGLRGRRDGRD